MGQHGSALVFFGAPPPANPVRILNRFDNGRVIIEAIWYSLPKCDTGRAYDGPEMAPEIDGNGHTTDRAAATLGQCRR